MTAAGADEAVFGQLAPARRNEIGQMFARFDRRTPMGSITGTGVSISPRTRSPLCRERLYVLGRHLERFGAKRELVVTWQRDSPEANGG